MNLEQIVEQVTDKHNGMAQVEAVDISKDQLLILTVRREYFNQANLDNLKATLEMMKLPCRIIVVPEGVSAASVKMTNETDAALENPFQPNPFDVGPVTYRDIPFNQSRQYTTPMTYTTVPGSGTFHYDTTTAPVNTHRYRADFIMTPDMLEDARATIPSLMSHMVTYDNSGEEVRVTGPGVNQRDSE